MSIVLASRVGWKGWYRTFCRIDLERQKFWASFRALFRSLSFPPAISYITEDKLPDVLKIPVTNFSLPFPSHRAHNVKRNQTISRELSLASEKAHKHLTPDQKVYVYVPFSCLNHAFLGWGPPILWTDSIWTSGLSECYLTFWEYKPKPPPQIQKHHKPPRSQVSKSLHELLPALLWHESGPQQNLFSPTSSNDFSFVWVSLGGGFSSSESKNFRKCCLAPSLTPFEV